MKEHRSTQVKVPNKADPVLSTPPSIRSGGGCAASRRPRRSGNRGAQRGRGGAQLYSSSQIEDAVRDALCRESADWEWCDREEVDLSTSQRIARLCDT